MEHCIIFMSLILIINLLGFYDFAGATTTLIQDTCMKMSKSDPKNINYDFCVKTFESDPRSSNTTLDGLAEISFKISISKATSISSTIHQLLKGPKFDPFVKGGLKVCLEMYSDAPDDLKQGLEALKSGDWSTANIRISGALDCGPNCEDGFTEHKGVVSPLTKENSDYFDVVVISLALTNLLKKD